MAKVQVRGREVERRWLLRGVAALLIVGLLASAVGATLAYERPEVGAGNVTEPANGSTLVAVQGFHYQGEDWEKKQARLFSFDERGNVSWEYGGSQSISNWFYDADPLPNGRVLAVNTIREDGVGKTLVYELDPETRQRYVPSTNRPGSIKFNISDTHDADLINGDELIVANMREGVNDRIFIYNVTQNQVTWQWYFDDHYPLSTDGGIPKNDDWSHVNDVDKVGDGKFMLSPRNFDEVIVIDRETGNITTRLGEDDAHDILNEQHNPAYLETEDGNPAFLVADSENDRIVEYTCTERVDGECEWALTWEVGTDGQLDWPRDANRLPNGNTLVTDSLNNRVIEVTPTGRIVWETTARWAPFSAERVVHGNDGVRSPTMQDLGVEGSYGVRGSAGVAPGTGDSRTFPQWLRATFGGVPVINGLATDLADTWAGAVPWIRPPWIAPWSLVYLVAALLVGIVWGASEGVYQRRRIEDRVRRVSARVR
jgi:hypothetical protein